MKIFYTLSLLSTLSVFTDAVNLHQANSNSLRETMLESLGDNNKVTCSGKKKCKTKCEAFGDPHVETYGGSRFILKGTDNGYQPLYVVEQGKKKLEVLLNIETENEGEYILGIKFDKKTYTTHELCDGLNYNTTKNQVVVKRSEATKTIGTAEISLEISCALPGKDTVNKKGVDPNKYHFDVKVYSPARSQSDIPVFSKETGACVHSKKDRECGCSCDIACNDFDLKKKELCNKQTDSKECYNYLMCMYDHGCGTKPPGPPPSGDCDEKLKKCFKNNGVTDFCKGNPLANGCEKSKKCYFDNNCAYPSDSCSSVDEETCEQEVPSKCMNGVNDNECNKYYKCLRDHDCPVPEPKCNEKTKRKCKEISVPSICKDPANQNSNECSSYYECFKNANCPPPSPSPVPPSPTPAPGPGIKSNQKIVCTSHCASKGDPHFTSFFGGKWKVYNGIRQLYIYKNQHQEITGEVEDLSKTNDPMEFITKIHWKFGNNKKSFSRDDCEPGKTVPIKNTIDTKFNGKPMSSQIDGYIECEKKSKNNIQGKYQLKIRFVKRDRFIAGNAPSSVKDVQNMIDVETNWLQAPLKVKNKNDIWGCMDHNTANINAYTRAECKLKDKWDNETNSNNK